MTTFVPSEISLFGPVDEAGALKQVVDGSQYHWPGACITSHVAVFQSELKLAPLKQATWRMCIRQPQGRSIFRLVTCNDGPTNIQAIGWIDTNQKPAGIDVWNAPVDVTAAINAFLLMNPANECNVGWQVAGDNTYPFTVYNCRLELTWEID